MDTFLTPYYLKRWAPIAGLILVLALFIYAIGPVSPFKSEPKVFEVKSGQGFRAITGKLSEAGLIRSSLATEILATITGRASRLQPGLYKLSPNMSSLDILGALTDTGAGEVTVTIPEGTPLVRIDEILSDALVIPKGALVTYSLTRSGPPIEGRLFPDTYRFFTGAPVEAVVQRMLDNFEEKAGPILASDPKNRDEDLIIASIVEKEVPDPEDRKIVAGIYWKRLSIGMPLQADATLCYAKLPAACYPVTALDKRIESPYNTYLYKGLPPAPIGNPGVTAITAAVHPKTSPYLFYISDPNTGKTIFAKTLDEQNQNRVKYIKSN